MQTTPEDPIVHFHMGLALFAQGHAARSRAYFIEAATLRPNLERASFYAGYASFQINDHASAEGYFQKTLAIQPRYTDAYVHPAKSLLMQGKETEARRYARHGVSHAESPETLRTELADLLRR